MSQKILLVAPAWVGDLVMSHTLIRFLKKQYNNVTIDVLANLFLHPLVLRMIEVDTIIENPFQHGELSLFKRIKFGIKLRKNKYDEVIVLPNSIKSVIAPFFANIKKRTGFIGESRYLFLNNYFKLDKNTLPLMIDRFCALANNGEKVHDIRFPTLKVDLINQNTLIQNFNSDKNRILIAFCPAAEYGQAKRWPPEYFAKLANLLDATKYQIVILGSKKDRAISQIISKNTNNPITDLCGKTDLKDVVDILALSKFTITNDSGLMHIAASVNSHVIAIYGSTSEMFTPPLTTKSDIIKIKLECAPCFARTCQFGHYNCLTLISPDMIFNKIYPRL